MSKEKIYCSNCNIFLDCAIDECSQCGDRGLKLIDNKVDEEKIVNAFDTFILGVSASNDGTKESLVKLIDDFALNSGLVIENRP
ncbi:MAG: hypothetical protein OCC45_07450 [Desulfotalea sp.]